MSTNNKSAGFSKEEQAAMRARAKELAAEARASKNKAAGEKTLLDAIANMPEPDKGLATKIHEIVSKTAPQLWPKTWYGFPAYATKEGKVICFFQFAAKFESRYATLGFNDLANLDEGNMWPTAFAVIKIGPQEEAKIVDLVKKAVSKM